MQNLRDQLLKTGLINKGQKHQVEQEKRHERKQVKKGLADDLSQVQQRQAYEARLEAQRAADRERAAIERQKLEAREKLLQIRQVIAYWQHPEEASGTRRWYFLTRNNALKYVYVANPTALQLETGALAIVEHPDDTEPRYVLVERDAAEVIARVDTQYIRFHNLDPVTNEASSDKEM